jgi:hypothetical protein
MLLKFEEYAIILVNLVGLKMVQNRVYYADHVRS